MINHLLLPLAKKTSSTSLTIRFYIHPEQISEVKRRYLVQIFRTAQESILISVNHLTVYLNIYLQVKLKRRILHVFAEGMVCHSWHIKRDSYAIKHNTTTTYWLILKTSACPPGRQRLGAHHKLCQ